MQKTNVPNHPPNCPNCITSTSSPQKTLVWPKTKKKGKNSQYWLINIIAEVRLNVPASSISLPIYLIKQSRTWNTQSPWYICYSSCAYKILLTPKALGIKFLVKYFWDEHIHILQVKFVCTCIILFQLAPSRGASQQPLQPLARKREDYFVGHLLRDTSWGMCINSKFIFCLCNEESLWLAPIKENSENFDSPPQNVNLHSQNINYTAIFVLKHYKVFPFDPLIKVIRVQLWAKVTV